MKMKPLNSIGNMVEAKMQKRIFRSPNVEVNHIIRAIKTKLKSAIHPIENFVLTNRWELHVVKSESPYPVPTNIEDQCRLLLGLFDSADRVGVSETTYKPQFTYKLNSEWIREANLSGKSVRSCVIPSLDRFGEPLIERFLFLRSKFLPARKFLPIVRFLRRSGIELKAIIETQHRAVEAWFTYPGREVVDELQRAVTVTDSKPLYVQSIEYAKLPGESDRGFMRRLIWVDQSEGGLK